MHEIKKWAILGNFFLVASFLSIFATAYGGTAMQVRELPNGSNVTIPGGYPIKVAEPLDFVLSGTTIPQNILLINETKAPCFVQVYATFEKTPRTIHLAAGGKTVYGLQQQKPVRIKVIKGDLVVNSTHPLNVAR